MEKRHLITKEANVVGKNTVRVCVSSGRVDRYQEIVDPNGIDYENFDKHPILLSSHRTDTLTSNIGRAIGRSVEDGKVYMDFEYFVGEGNFEADWGYKLAQKGVASYSIGFLVRDWKKGDGNINRVYTDIELLEVSQVLLPANPDAVQEGAILEVIKSFAGYKEKGVIPYVKLPLAPKDAKWSFTSEDSNAILGDPPNWDRYRKAFCWYDSSNPEVRQSYKLPIAKMYNGSLHVFWRGVIAAMAAILGARGGTNIPEKDRKGVYNRLVKYYKDFGETPPEFHAINGDGEKDGRGLNSLILAELDVIETKLDLIMKKDSDIIEGSGEASTNKSIPKGVKDEATILQEVLKKLREGSD